MKLPEKLKCSLRALIARLPFIPKKKVKKEAYKETYNQYPDITIYSNLYGVILIPAYADYYGIVINPITVSTQSSDNQVYYA